MSKNQKAVIKLNKEEKTSASKIDLIKNLIFGDEFEAYDSEFDTLKQDILNKKKVLEELIEEVKTDLNTAIDSVATDVNIRITELEDKFEDKLESVEAAKVDKKALGQLLIDLGEKVGQK